MWSLHTLVTKSNNVSPIGPWSLNYNYNLRFEKGKISWLRNIRLWRELISGLQIFRKEKKIKILNNERRDVFAIALWLRCQRIEQRLYVFMFVLTKRSIIILYNTYENWFLIIHECVWRKKKKRVKWPLNDIEDWWEGEWFDPAFFFQLLYIIKEKLSQTQYQ